MDCCGAIAILVIIVVPLVTRGYSIPSLRQRAPSKLTVLRSHTQTNRHAHTSIHIHRGVHRQTDRLATTRIAFFSINCIDCMNNRPNTESAESATQRLQQQQHCHGNSNDMLTYAALRTRARTPHSTASQLSSPASAAAVALRAAQHEKRPLHPRRPTRA
ncbi:hypothetical protein LOAG_00515 [Loa loa]|uniref:Uncharacterized protein n=1 Tax=Loa loa TaxID=7209 RepID=A0A1S0UB25_LOALO|nr:hypothetical protein LOAG_00515 [Loa loa]EFO27975.1 hypothetical protein LOAG_00515 [Loa loa]